MPTTINGIGTSYWGRSNRQVRTGTCRNCGRVGALESYDTRLWFVVVFIPIVPLGRKRIIDQCGSCQRHFAADKDQYEATRQSSVAAAQQHYQQQPTIETALETHGALLSFHEYSQAAAFRAEALARFPSSAELRAALASHLQYVDQWSDAVVLYHQAWDLKPDLPAACVGVSRHLMQQGKLDAAHEILGFLLKPGAGQSWSLEPLEQLAYAYQAKGRHAEVLDLCEHIIAELPAVADHREFRNFMRKSEKAVGLTQSTLPDQKRGLLDIFNSKSVAYAPWQRRTAYATLFVALVAIGLALHNEYIRTHRTLHIVNGFGQPATVAIDGEPPTSVGSKQGIVLSEGPHHATIGGPLDDEVTFEMQTGYFDRWFKQPVWVLNVGGAGVLGEGKLLYAKHPRPGEQKLLVGEPFLFFDDIDYVFVKPPDSIKLDHERQEITRKELQFVGGEPDDVAQHLALKSPEVALRYAESHLPQHAEDLDLIQQYIQLATQQEQAPRAEAFLKVGCARRPIAVNWHRAYQTLLEQSGRQEQLLAEYDAALQADPQNGALLYLLGRITSDHTAAHELYTKSTAADPSLPWPWYAMGYHQAGLGEWEACLQSLDKALERQMDAKVVEDLRHTARLARGDVVQLESEYHEQLQAEPQNVRALLCLCEVLLARKQPEDARQALARWENQIASQRNSDTTGVFEFVRQMVLYGLGDFAALEESLKKSGGMISIQLQGHLLLNTQRAEQAAQDDTLAELWDDPFEALGLCVAFAKAGDAERADHWREHACEILEKRNSDNRLAAKFLQADAPTPVEEILHLNLDLRHKVVLLAALAQKFADASDDYESSIQRLNVRRSPPYHLVNQAVE